MSLITTATTFRNLKATLDTIVTDKNDGLEAKAVWKKYLIEKTMADNYEDDAEVGGPGLLTEKPEGQDAATGSINDGFVTRYIARTFAMRALASEEALEDGKYEDYINLAKRLKRSAFKTIEIDAANLLNRAANSAYIGGDGVSLANSAHTIPGGGTFSNTLSTPFSPSRAALIVVTTNLAQLPGHDGVTEGYMPEKIVCPQGQWAVWEGIVGSTLVPESNNNEINVFKGMGLEVVPVKYWTASTTNWAVLSDADNGLQWRWRRKMKSRTWVDNDAYVMKYGISYRSSRGWSDARAFYFSNA